MFKTRSCVVKYLPSMEKPEVQLSDHFLKRERGGRNAERWEEQQREGDIKRKKKRKGDRHNIAGLEGFSASVVYVTCYNSLSSFKARKQDTM